MREIFPGEILSTVVNRKTEMARFYTLILTLAVSVCQSQSWRLNVPRVLLPLADEGAKFMVYSQGSFFITYNLFTYSWEVENLDN